MAKVTIVLQDIEEGDNDQNLSVRIAFDPPLKRLSSDDAEQSAALQLGSVLIRAIQSETITEGAQA